MSTDLHDPMSVSLGNEIVSGGKTIYVDEPVLSGHNVGLTVVDEFRELDSESLFDLSDLFVHGEGLDV